MNSKTTIINSLRNSVENFNELISKLNKEEFETNIIISGLQDRTYFI